MLWPSRGDYEKAVRFLFNENVLDPQFIGGKPLEGISYAGGYSINFPIEVSNFNLLGSKIFGLRCWTRGAKETYETRYEKIETYLKRVNLPYFIDFKYNYADEGILIAGKKYPTLRMEWVEGQTLREFVQDNLDDPSILKMAATKFQQMVAALHQSRISHGDLQSGNILLMRKGMNVDIKLIDYDSLRVPGIYDRDQITRGIREYQHPDRIKGTRITDATKVDYFSELVIYLSLISLAENPELWNLIENKTEKGLLFSASDFENPNQSDIFHKLESLSEDVQYLAVALQCFCQHESFRLLVPLENILPKTGQDAKFYHRLGSYLLQQGKYRTAIKYYQSAINSDPNLKEAHCELGVAYLGNKEHTKAITPLRKVISLDPDSAYAHSLLGSAYLKLDKPEEATWAAEKALLIQPNDSEARKLLVNIKRYYYYRGVCCFNSEQYDEAITEFQNAIAIDSNFKGAYRHLGETYLKLGKLESALKSVQKALMIAADYQLAQILLGNIKQTYHTRGKIYLKHKQYTDAIIAFKAVVDIDPEFADGRCNLGNAYFKFGRIEEARGEAEAALKIQSACQPAKGLLEKIKLEYKNFGDSYEEKRGYPEAVKAYQQAIAIDPNYKDALYSLGITYSKMGEFSESIKFYQRAVTVDPKYKEAYFELGKGYQEIAIYEQAVKAYQQAIAIDPNYRDAYYHLGMLYGKMSKFAEAVKAYQQAIRIDPKDSIVHYGLAQAYFKLRKFQEAKESVEKGLKFYPNYQPGLELLKSINNELLKKANQIVVPVGMVHIPEGEFQMGRNGGRPNETPVHTVYTEAFYIDKYPVTNAQYKKFIDAKPEWGKPAKWYQFNKRHISHIPREYHDGNYLKHWIGNSYPPNIADHPVVYVSWYAAMAFAEWAGKRLPTESEWEKASRGGLMGKKYPWGDSIDTDKVNYGYNIAGATTVGHYEANGYGVYDMCGNVWEWCLDRYDNGFYARSPRRNPIADGNILNVTHNFKVVKTSRVLRGGVEFGSNKIVSIAYRSADQPSSTGPNYGFRCVQDIGD